MAKKKKAQVAEKAPETKSQDSAPYWDTFFRDQRNPVLRSQLITALMAGKQLELDRLPAAVLLDVVLMSMTTRNYFEAEIIDDYEGLLRRTEEKWRDPLWCCKVFDQRHSCTASFILMGTKEFKCPEDQYIPDLVQWYLEHDPPLYFEKELTEADVKKHRKAAAA